MIIIATKAVKLNVIITLLIRTLYDILIILISLIIFQTKNKNRIIRIKTKKPLYCNAGYKIIARGIRNKLIAPDQKTTCAALLKGRLCF